MNRIKKRSPQFAFNSWTIVTLVALILIMIFIVYPFVLTLAKSAWNTERGFTLENYIRFFTSKFYRMTLFNSLKVSSLATLFAVAVGVPMAYFVSRFQVKGKAIIDNMCILAMLSPPFIGAYSWIVLLGKQGFITTFVKNLTGISLPTIYGFRGILLVFCVKLFPYVYLYVSGALGNIDRSLEEASESLGYSGIRKIATVTFPLILPTILSSALMVFMTSLADFGTPMLIGEGFRVLPVVIYDEHIGEMGGDTNFANALSVIVILIAMVMLILQKKAISGRSYTMGGSGLNAPQRKSLSFVPHILTSGYVYLIALIGVLPQITVAVSSFLNTNGPVFTSGFGLDSYREAFGKLSTSIRNSFVFSFAAIVVMILISLLVAYLSVRKASPVTNFIDTMVMFPYVIPGAVLGVMMVTAFNRGPIVLTGTAFILILSYVIRKLPFTLRSSVGILYQIDSSVEEASISLGVAPFRTFFKITAKMMIPGVISGAIVSWISTINELSSTIILYTGKTMTISVAMYLEITARTHYGTAAALATILTLATALALFICNKILGGRITL